MRATTTAPTQRIEVINDLFGCRQTMDSPTTREQLIERLLWLENSKREEGPEPALCACFHIYRTHIVAHFFAAPGREEEALAELREGGVDV